MKKLIIIAFAICTVLVSCKDDDSDCDYGFEGDDCTTEINEKFIGNYNTTYTGNGAALDNTSGTTVAKVSKGDRPSTIEIEVALDLAISLIGQNVDLPLNVVIQATVEDDKYFIPETTITPSLEGLPIPVDLIFEVEGTLIGNQLNSTLTMSGLISGTVDMQGTK